MTASSPSTPTPTAARSPTASPGRAARPCATSCAPARRSPSYNDISNIVARDETRLDILASDTDPHVSEAFSDVDYREVAQVAAHYYSIVLTDTGTGIVHSVMGATLDLADQLVVVAGLSIDEARLASETLTWLEANGYSEQVRNAVVVLNQASPGAPVVRLDEVRDALPEPRARCRAHPVRPAHRRRKCDHASATCSPRRGSPRARSRPRSSRAFARSPPQPPEAMAVRSIRLFGDPVLRAPSAPIDEVDDGVRALVRDLVDTVEPPGRAGVAAPQIGVALRAFSYNIDGDIGYVLNPRIVELRGEPEPVGEGCLSVPGLWHDALRHPYARVEGIDLDGQPVVLEGEGLHGPGPAARDRPPRRQALPRAPRARRPAASRCARCGRAPGSEAGRISADAAASRARYRHEKGPERIAPRGLSWSLPPDGRSRAGSAESVYERASRAGRCSW